MQESQQYYCDENKETSYGIHQNTSTIPPSSSDHDNSVDNISNQYPESTSSDHIYAVRKRGSRKAHKREGSTNTGSPTQQRSAKHVSTPPPSHPTSSLPVHSHSHGSLLGSGESFIIDILTKDGKVKHGSIIDIQQQFFKSLTNDLIKTTGSVILKPIASSGSNPGSPSSRKIGAQADDEKGQNSPLGKRQMSKTLDPARSLSRSSSPPALSLLSCSAPAHAGNVFSGSTSPRPLRSSNGSLSPGSSRRARDSPAAIVADLAIQRAALNPAGLPMGYSPPGSPSISPSSSPLSSPTSMSTPMNPFSPFSSVHTSAFAVSPKPLRPMHVQPSSPRASRTSSPLVENVKPTSESKEISVEDTIKPKAHADQANEMSKPTEEEEETESETKDGVMEVKIITEPQVPTETQIITETVLLEAIPEITAEPTQTKLEPQLTTEPVSPTPVPTEPTITTESTQVPNEPTPTTAEPVQSVTEPAPAPAEPAPVTSEPTPEQATSQPTWVQSKVEDVLKPKPYPTRPSAGTYRLNAPFLAHASVPPPSSASTPSTPSTPATSSTPTTPSTPTTATSTATTPSVTQSSLSLSNWTSCRPHAHPTNGSTFPHRSQPRPHPQGRPLSTIGVIRSSPSSSSSPSSLSPSAPNFTQYAMNPSLRSQPTTPSTPTSLAPPTPSPTASRTPSPNPNPLQFSGDMPQLNTTPSTPTTPTTPSPLTATTPPRDPLHLFPPLALSGSYSPTPCIGDSPSQSPRDAEALDHARRVTESPRGWGVEDIAITTGWRSPTLSYSTNSLPFPCNSSPRPGRSATHRLVRGNTSMVDLHARASPESPSPLAGNDAGAGRPHAGSGSGFSLEGNNRPHAGSGSGPSIPRSSSEPNVPDPSARSGSMDHDDPTQPDKPQPLMRTLSGWQLKNGNSEFIDLEESFSENRTDLIYTHTKAGMKIVKAGTLNALIEVLTYQKQSDPAFVDAFLLTYTSFTTPMTLLEKLIERYNQTPPPGLTPEQREEYENDSLIVRLRVCSVLKSWADKYFYDFQNEPLLVDKFVDFMEGLKERGMEKVAGTIGRALQKKLDGAEKRIIVTPSTPVPPPFCPKPGDALTLMNFEDVEVARQLTLMEYESYCCIRPRECLNQAWNKPNREDESPNIVTMIRRSNNIPLWVATEIVKEDKLQRRAAILKKFINIAEFCRQLNNFNAVMEIISGLNLTPVYRLRKTWDALPRKQLIFFEQLCALMAPKSNFKVYREELHTKNPPCVPFLGRYLTDLTFIEDAAKESGEGMINFVKRMQLSVVIREIQQYQQTPYHLAVVPGIRDYLSKLESFSENELFAQSRILEPPAS